MDSLRVRRLTAVLEPEGCPIVPLGISGLTLHVFNALGQYTQIRGDQITANTAETLVCGKRAWLCQTFPKRVKRGTVAGAFDAVAFGTWLRAFCSAWGPFDPARLRGRGAWLGLNGDLIVHLGDQLCIPRKGGGMARAELGRRNEFFYPTRPSLPLPIVRRDKIGTAAAQSCQRALRGFQFARGELDQLFVLGFLGQAFVAGARRSRSSMILSGDTQSGKSLLLSWMEAVLGEWCVLSSDATAAGVRQRVASDALTVLLDEAERGGGPQRRAQTLEQVRMIRATFGGGVWLRGRADHEGVSEELRCPLLLAAIVPPLLTPADRSRVAQLHLAADLAAAPTQDLFGRAPVMGREMAGRLLANWRRLCELDDVSWLVVLAEAGITGRQAETLANLLACASVLLTEPDELPALQARHRAGLVAFGDTLACDRRRLWQEALTELRALGVPAERAGEPMRSLGELWLCGAGYGGFELDEPAAPGIIQPRPQGEREARQNAHSDAAHHARRRLAQLGFAIADDGPARVLLIARHAPALLRLLRDTALGERADGGVVNLLTDALSARWWPQPVAFAFGKEAALAISLDLALAGMAGADRVGTAEAWDQTAERPK